MSQIIAQRQTTTDVYAAASSRAAVHSILNTFDYDGVTLLPSSFREQMERARGLLRGSQRRHPQGVPPRGWSAGARQRHARLVREDERRHLRPAPQRHVPSQPRDRRRRATRQGHHAVREWPCCSGTYLQTVADYHNVIYFHDPAGLSVNLFVPSEVTRVQDGQSVRLRQETGFPNAETTDLTVHLERPLRFRLRVPGWCAGFSLRINDAPVSVDGIAGEWASIEREWQPGDRVTARFPMRLRMVPVDKDHPRRVAIMFGPTVLGQDEACCRRPFDLAPGAELSSRLVREGEALRFRILDIAPERHPRWLQPFSEFPAFWPYWIYFDLDAASLY